MTAICPRPAWYALATIAAMTPSIGVMAANGVIPGLTEAPARPVILTLAAIAAGLAHVLGHVLEPKRTSDGHDTRILVAICAFAATMVAILELNRESGQPHGLTTSLLILLGIAIAGAMVSALRVVDLGEPPEAGVIPIARRIGPAATMAAAAVAAAAPGLLASWLIAMDPILGLKAGLFMATSLGMAPMFLLIWMGYATLMRQVDEGDP